MVFCCSEDTSNDSTREKLLDISGAVLNRAAAMANCLRLLRPNCEADFIQSLIETMSPLGIIFIFVHTKPKRVLNIISLLRF